MDLFNPAGILNPDLLLMLPVLLFSLSVHECAHAVVADMGGDDTARLQGRITLNPIPHIDPIGTILMPLLAAMANFPVIGWARPVPVNVSRLKRDSWMVLVAIAGPISNVLIALAATIALKATVILMGASDVPEVMVRLSLVFITINVALAIFNMLPIPPLDGSKLLFHYVFNGKPHLYPLWEGMERFGFIFLYLLLVINVTKVMFALAVTVPARALINFTGVLF